MRSKPPSRRASVTDCMCPFHGIGKSRQWDRETEDQGVCSRNPSGARGNIRRTRLILGVKVDVRDNPGGAACRGEDSRHRVCLRLSARTTRRRLARGTLVEFKFPETIRLEYRDGVREFAYGGRWDTLAGQPTDDTEMAFSPDRTLVAYGTYSADEARRAYRRWFESDAFGVGFTVMSGSRIESTRGAKLTTCRCG